MKFKLYSYSTLCVGRALLALLLLAAVSVFGNDGETEKRQNDVSLVPFFESSVFSSQLVPRLRNQGHSITVADVEALYSAVNNPANIGATIVLAPNVYMLSVNGPGAIPRPNGGRLELQQDMSLTGESNDSEDAVIDAGNLPLSSYQIPPLTGAIRIGRGSNSIESLTIRNAVNGSAGIEADINFGGVASIRIVKVIATGNARGIDIRNFGPSAVGRVIEADIRDNDLFNNTAGMGQGIRFVNQANGGVIVARLKNNRSHGNRIGMLVADNTSSFASISIDLSGDKFYGNGAGTILLGGLSSGTAQSNGNTINLEGHACHFTDNNSAIGGDVGGLLVFGGENTSFPNGASNNTVNVRLRGCKLENNQVMDLAAFGARSNPVTIGTPGTNNRVTIDRNGPGNPSIVEVFVDSLPAFPGGGNLVIH